MNLSDEKPTVDSLRSKVTKPAQLLLDEMWTRYSKTGEWPIARTMFSLHGKSQVKDCLSSLGGSVVWENEDTQHGSRFTLTLLGVFLTSEGSKLQQLLVKYFQFQWNLFKTTPEKRFVLVSEFPAALTPSEEETKTLGRLIYVGNLGGGSLGNSTGIWGANSLTEVEDYTENTDIPKEVEFHALRNYSPGQPVFLADRRNWQPAVAKITSFQKIATVETEDRQRTISLEGDPLKRRYQVFVSSTYNDLLEERKHVIQALLETKCIPSGMELFPAANLSQWHLIQGVIDDCDYYLLIVAGKYGTIGPEGTSFTEMEFDYAVKKAKPILVFYHSEIRKLPMEKSEDTDIGRRNLEAFTKKAKQNRLCRSWNTPEGLASAIKTSILNAIETDPKPGWVRANSTPSWSMVERLERQIAELETAASEE